MKRSGSGGRSIVCGSGVAAAAVLLAACGGVKIAPTVTLPRALIERIPVKVAVVVPVEQREFTHAETRSGVSWEIALGGGHLKMVQDLFGAEFDQAVVVKTLEEAKLVPDIRAIFEPRIEQYSFATARDTGSNYYAATILYRIHLYNPAGERVDSFSLTGYGTSLTSGLKSQDPLSMATRAAMRDAAAKFMVQFPQQRVAQQLSKREPLLAVTAGGAGAASAFELIEAVPIRE
ncbi:MAG: hypothetical protein NZM12_04645 [Steroidobacteraceae bacterium]|nr:hypothetical protein [Steroidobacteraceae bacterium]MDW8259836.1 hypothetical protein [Gammaproteobacteria bacterium]